MAGRTAPAIKTMLGIGRFWARPVVQTPFRLNPVRLIYHKHINYYDILGVERHADEKTIKFAYFKMAKKFHPDTNKNLDARQMFEMIAEAYDVLSDEKRRAEYDETGQSSERFGGRAEGPGRQSSDATYTAEQMYSKIFGSSEGIFKLIFLPHRIIPLLKERFVGTGFRLFGFA
jgi:curved DNA-binding protein CbpA